MRKYTRTTAYRDESRLFYAAVGAFVLTLGLYMYFVSASVMHVVMRKEIESNIAAVGTSISELEATYIEMQHSVSNDIATQRGFVAADAKVFIRKGGDTLVLSRN